MYIDEKKKLAFFIGAGASIFPPSWLPLADELKENILTSLCDRFSYKLRKDDFTVLATFPLEFLLQVLRDVKGDKAVKETLKPLKSGFPNAVHHFIANLIKRNICDVVITVNFDTLLEKALRMARCHFQVFTEEEVLSPPSLSINDSAHIYKFHGSLDNTNSLLATIERVGKPLSLSRRKCLEEVLDTRHIIFLGYRGADVDIKPILQKWLIRRTGSYYWNSYNTKGIDEDLIRLMDEDNLTLGDGLDFIKNLMNTYPIERKYEITIKSSEAQIAVKRIFGHIGRAENLIKHLYQVIPKSPKKLLNYYKVNFRSEVQLGKWDVAKTWLEKWEKLLPKLKNSDRLSEEMKFSLELGKFLLGAGDKNGLNILHNLLENFNLLKPQEINEELNWHRIVLLQILIENYPSGIREGDDPWEYIKKAYSYAGTHVQLRAVIKRTEAILYSRTGKHKKAISLFNEALKDTEMSADHNGKLILLRELAHSYIEEKDFQNSIEVIKKAEDFLRMLENNGVSYPIHQAQILEEKSIYFHRKMNKTLSRKYATEAKRIYNQIGAPLQASKLEEKLKNTSDPQS